MLAIVQIACSSLYSILRRCPIPRGAQAVGHPFSLLSPLTVDEAFPSAYTTYMATVEQVITAEQLFGMPGHEHFELVEGELVRMSPPGFDHGCIVGEIHAAIREFVRAARLGSVAVEAGFVVSHDPDTVRSPDVAFVRAERVPPGGVKAFFDGAPDLAVEVICPSDRASEVMAKAGDWLRFGCTVVWVIDPETKAITVYSKRVPTLFLSANDTLVCEELLPGFSVPVAQVFAR
jgi:Uma2 family endonuclease